jgi:hypothetical protein
MRLSQDKARKLSALVWRERARRWLPVLAVVLALAGAFALVLANRVSHLDRTVDVKERDGLVTGLKSGGNARGAAVVSVHLADGRDVEAFSGFRVVPSTGAHVVVAEERHASGRLTYDVLRVLDH